MFVIAQIGTNSGKINGKNQYRGPFATLRMTRVVVGDD